MTHLLRVMTYNVLELTLGGKRPKEEMIEAVAFEIDRQQPDLVLLNEMMHYFGSNPNETVWLA